ncbi:MAG: AMP-binding protein [Polyangia bacterium]
MWEHPATIGAALAEMAQLRPTASALETGGDPPVTYLQLHLEAEQVANRLRALGLRLGQAVLVVCRTRARVPALVHGVLLAGGVVVSIEPSTPPVQLRTLVTRAHVALAMGDPDLLDWLAPKLVEPVNPARPQDPHVAIIDDAPPLAAPLDPPGAVRTPADRIAFVIFTSGSTGVPKGVLLSHGNMLRAARRMTEVRAHRPSDRHLSYLSFAHLAEIFMSVVLPMASGYSVVFPRGRRLTEAVAAVRPTFFMGVPAEWQTLATAAAALHGQSHEVRSTLGLERVRLALSTGAPLAIEAHRALFKLGIPVHEMYGMTETSGASSYNAPGDSVMGAVGKALPGSRVEVDDTGEVLLFGKGFRCIGYLDDPQATSDLFVGDDGVRTGDLGRIEDGFLHITGRRKDLLVLSTGKKVHPASLEARLASLPGVRHAAVFGEGHAHVVAVLDAISDPRLRTALMTPDELRAHLTLHVRLLNEELGRHERIVAIGVAPQPFSIPSGELTPSLKVRRDQVRERHKGLIDALLNRNSGSSANGDILRFEDV